MIKSKCFAVTKEPLTSPPTHICVAITKIGTKITTVEFVGDGIISASDFTSLSGLINKAIESFSSPQSQESDSLSHQNDQ